MRELTKYDWDKIEAMVVEKPKVYDLLKGLIAMTEELEKENGMLRAEVKALLERLKYHD